jgi:hypothetical protein
MCWNHWWRKKCFKKDCSGRWQSGFHVRSGNNTSEGNLIESKEAESSESEHAKIAAENTTSTYFFKLKTSFLTNLCRLNILQMVNVMKSCLRAWSLELTAFSQSFRKVGPGILLHDNAPAHSSGVVSRVFGEMGHPIRPKHLIWRRLTFLS